MTGRRANLPTPTAWKHAIRAAEAAGTPAGKHPQKNILARRIFNTANAAAIAGGASLHKTCLSSCRKKKGSRGLPLCGTAKFVADRRIQQKYARRCARCLLQCLRCQAPLADGSQCRRKAHTGFRSLKLCKRHAKIHTLFGAWQLAQLAWGTTGPRGTDWDLHGLQKLEQLHAKNSGS